MKIATAHLKSISPYSQSRHYAGEFPKEDKENHQDYEKRTWKNRLHTDKNGNVFIPPMALKNCISEAAKYLSIQIPGKGKATYTKHIESGLLIVDPLQLGIHKDEVDGQWLFVPSDGKRGGSSRVNKCFPIIREWEATATINILDDTVTKEVFEHILTESGKFIGMGFFRPRNNGFYGRFEVKKIEWQ